MSLVKIPVSITDRSDAAVNNYLKEISRHPLISPEEEVALAQRIHDGDEEALQRLVNGNLRFVVSVAKQHQHQGLPLADLINEGNIGLIKAAHRFDEKRGFKFISYAVWWVRQSILAALAEQGRTVRLPRNQQAFLNKVRSCALRLEQRLERQPSEAEIAADLGLEEQVVKAAMARSGSTLSLDMPVGDGEEATLGDTLASGSVPPADSRLLEESLSQELHTLLGSLKEEQRDVLLMSFGIGHPVAMSHSEIAHHMQLSQERVRQIRNQALHRLRSHSSAQRLRAYL